MGKHAKLKEKQKWSEEKLHLENARKLRGICFIDPEDTEFKETTKNAREKLETSVALAMPWKIPAAKAAVDKEWEKLEKISQWNLTKVKSKKQVIDEARMSGATVHFASLMDICHLKNAELEAQSTKSTKVVLYSVVIL